MTTIRRLALALALGSALAPLPASGGERPFQPAAAARPSPEAAAPDDPRSAAVRGAPARAAKPFGANLFEGRSAAAGDGLGDPDRVAQPGDRMAVRLWGAVSHEAVNMVEADGTVFVPEVGPVKVAGLTASGARDEIRRKASGVYTGGVNVHAALQETRALGVFVTGAVASPGRHLGSQTDSVLDFLLRAGGVDPGRGSFRRIDLIRGGRTVATVDLYDFLASGRLAPWRFAEGDTVMVREAGIGVAATGAVRNQNRFEAVGRTMGGAELLRLASPRPGATHAMVSTVRGGQPSSAYVDLARLSAMTLEDGDVVDFRGDALAQTVSVTVEGPVGGPTAFSVARDATLRELLSHVAVDGAIVDPSAVHLRRASVARQQKAALETSLARLEQVALTARSGTAEEASVRVREAELVTEFVRRAREAAPEGRVVVMRDGELSDVRLQDGDVVVVPERSDVVMVHGEVMMPQAFVHRPGMRVRDYVERSGGLTDRGDGSRFVVTRLDGSSEVVSDAALRPGDQVYVLPAVDSKDFLMAKDIMQILYQLAVGASVVLRVL